MRQNRRIASRTCQTTWDNLSVWAYALLTATTLWGLFLGCAVTAPLDCGPEGTDRYFECSTGEPLDLMPLIEDEAQTEEGGKA